MSFYVEFFYILCPRMKNIAADAIYAPRIFKGAPVILNQVFKLLKMPLPQANPDLSLEFFNKLRETTIDFVSRLFRHFQSEDNLL